MRSIITQSKIHNIRTYISKCKTILFDFRKLIDTNEDSKIVSMLLFSVMKKILKSGSTAPLQTIPLYIDEVHNFDQEEAQNLLIYAKKYNVSVTLSTSRIGKVSENLLYELSRVGTVVGFRSVGKDMQIMQSILGIGQSNKEERLDLLKKYEAYIKTLHDGDPMVARKIDTTAKPADFYRSAIEGKSHCKWW